MRSVIYRTILNVSTKFTQWPDADRGGHGDRESIKDFTDILQREAANGLQVGSDGTVFVAVHPVAAE